MPLYLRKVGQEAEKEREEAIDRERKRAEKRAIMMSPSRSGELRQANENMANLQKVRRGAQPPPLPQGEGYLTPVYDPTMRCWKSYVETDGEQSERLWKAWCTDVNEWRNKEDYEQSHPLDDQAGMQDENIYPALPEPVPGLRRRSTTMSMKEIVRKLSGFGRRSAPQKAY